MEQAQEDEGKGKEAGDSPMTTHIRERLADTHDLLAEISLENERSELQVQFYSHNIYRIMNDTNLLQVSECCQRLQSCFGI